jgi:hypothetical protein
MLRATTISSYRSTLENVVGAKSRGVRSSA